MTFTGEIGFESPDVQVQVARNFAGALTAKETLDNEALERWKLLHDDDEQNARYEAAMQKLRTPSQQLGAQALKAITA